MEALPPPLVNSSALFSSGQEAAKGLNGPGRYSFWNMTLIQEPDLPHSDKPAHRSSPKDPRALVFVLSEIGFSTFLWFCQPLHVLPTDPLSAEVTESVSLACNQRNPSRARVL